MQCLNDYNQQNPLLDLRSNYFIKKKKIILKHSYQSMNKDKIIPIYTQTIFEILEKSFT